MAMIKKNVTIISLTMLPGSMAAQIAIHPAIILYAALFFLALLTIALLNGTLQNRNLHAELRVQRNEDRADYQRERSLRAECERARYQLEATSDELALTVQKQMDYIAQLEAIIEELRDDQGAAGRGSI